MMRHIFEHWNRVATRLRQASRIALFLDFDGTLAFIRSKPEEVAVDSAARSELLALARSPRFNVCVISGRRRRDLRARIRVPGIRCLGLYGWEGHEEVQLLAGTRRALAALKDRLEPLVTAIPGAWIEEKQHSLSVHYRGVPESESARIQPLIRHEVNPVSDLFRVQQGKSVWEIIPHELGDKGAAVIRELAAMPGSTLPIYVGDDRPDEAAFTALRGGITVLVGGAHASRAQYRLRGVPQVRIFLRKLKAEFA